MVGGANGHQIRQLIIKHKVSVKTEAFSYGVIIYRIWAIKSVPRLKYSELKYTE